MRMAKGLGLLILLAFAACKKREISGRESFSTPESQAVSHEEDVLFITDSDELVEALRELQQDEGGLGVSEAGNIFKRLLDRFWKKRDVPQTEVVKHEGLKPVEAMAVPGSPVEKGTVPAKPVAVSTQFKRQEQNRTPSDINFKRSLVEKDERTYVAVFDADIQKFATAFDRAKKNRLILIGKEQDLNQRWEFNNQKNLGGFYLSDGKYEYRLFFENVGSDEHIQMITLTRQKL